MLSYHAELMKNDPRAQLRMYDVAWFLFMPLLAFHSPAILCSTRSVLMRC